MYIREAHPDSILHAVKNGKDELLKIEQSKTLEERQRNAQLCTATLKLSFPALVDREDNRVNQAYAAWPDRLYIVGVDGKVAYMGGPGPWGFKVEELAAWLKKNTSK